MRLLPFLNAAVFLTISGAGYVRAGDLDKIDWPLLKEPAYQSKAPRYALLIFGPEARTRTWLVLDGTTLYIDRNGNGDLTEDGEKVAGKTGNQTAVEEDFYTFVIGELRDNDRRHRNVTLLVTGLSSASQKKTAATSNPPSPNFRIRMEAEISGFEGVTKDGRVLQVAGLGGALHFADRPREAPILHFAGPLKLVVFGQQEFRVNREMELYLGLGTQGRGQGTFVYTGYEGVVPPAVYPRAEIAFPAQKPGDPPAKVIYELKGRC